MIDTVKARETAQRMRDGMRFNLEVVAQMLVDAASEIEQRRTAMAQAQADHASVGRAFDSVFGKR